MIFVLTVSNKGKVIALLGNKVIPLLMIRVARMGYSIISPGIIAAFV